MKSKILLFLLLTFGLLDFHQSISQTFNVKTYSVNDGLPQSYIYTINQSPRGRLWIGTGEGLACFDGKKFIVYTVANGLAENFITTSLVDSKGGIWFGHYQGSVTYYDGNKFTKVPLGENIHSPVNVIHEDDKGTIFVGTQNNGIIRINSINSVEHFLENVSTPINSINSNEKGQIILGTGNGILIGRSTEKQFTIEKQILQFNSILKIVPKSNKKGLWISTSNSGIYEYLFNEKEDKIQKVETETILDDKNINILYEDEDNNLWIGVFGEGISKYKLNDGKYLKVEQYNAQTGLSNNYVKSFYRDREGNFWMGTFGGGLDLLLDPVFTLYTETDKLLTNNITALYHDSKNNLWIGTKKGLNQIPNSIFAKNYDIDFYDIRNGFNYGTITTIYEDNEGNILVGTLEFGILKFDKKKKKFIDWFYNKENRLTNKINFITGDKDGNIWIATEGGAFLYDSKSKEFLQYTMEDGLLHNNIFSIYVDSKNSIWFATHGTGLSSFQDGRIINYFSPNESTGLDINCFTEDSSGNLWIGTYGQGVFIFNGSKFVKKFTLENGLISNYCYSLIQDINNNIWIGHKTGISKYDYKKKSFSSYAKSSGFLVEGVNSNAICRDNQSNIWFGTTNGLLRYNINTDKPNTLGPLVNITSLSLFFQKTDWSKYSDSLVGLAQLPKNLLLPYNKNHLTFDVTGISLSAPDKIKYKYMLEGFEKEWSLPTNTNFITYSNLPPGDYIFRAKAQNNNGIWSEIPAMYHFTIQNPFWKTWWFFMLSSISGIILVSSIIKIRTSSLKRQQEVLQREKVKLEAEIKERKRAERKQKISEEKLKKTNQELNTFIYRASHDLRGPLSTVKGLTQLGLMEIKEEKSLNYFNLISDRINRLDSILKDLIYIVEVTEVPLQLEIINFNEILDSIQKEICQAGILNEIVYTHEMDVSTSFINDYKLIYTIFKNVIDNSAKYFNPENKITEIKIKIVDYRQGVKVTVIDNGVGIPKDLQPKIFDMFFRGTDQSKGSGLGLYLVKKIIDKLEGVIRVESFFFKGTKMEIYIPSVNNNPAEFKSETKADQKVITESPKKVKDQSPIL